MDNVFDWNLDTRWREERKNMPKWTEKSFAYCDMYSSRQPEDVPVWANEYCQVGYELIESTCLTSACIALYARVRLENNKCSKWMSYIDVMDRDIYFISEMAKFLLDGGAVLLYEIYAKERRWKGKLFMGE